MLYFQRERKYQFGSEIDPSRIKVHFIIHYHKWTKGIKGIVYFCWDREIYRFEQLSVHRTIKHQGQITVII